MNRLALLVCVFLFVSCGSQKKMETNKMIQFEQQIDSLRLEYRIPGMSVGISIDDSIHLIKGFGLANVEQKIPKEKKY